ncbi:MAG: RHS repeat-associated core domain-containing protein [Bacteroidales bacterium]|jgi:RHS repeat-associated protein|nr:RHS repeat-associated core domain-containing protein [Bacteroidales bacterium]
MERKKSYNYIGKKEKEPAFYYHSDHLGSASYVTNGDGKVTQTLNYLPYGEDWVDLQYFDLMPVESNLGVYKFNGKEKDAESGYNYYGARYYDSEKLSWLSVDPMSDKYPSLSPYVYCADNPVKLIDPNGKEIWILDEDGQRIHKVTENDMEIESTDERIQTMQHIYKSGNEGKNLMKQIMNSTKNSFEIPTKSKYLSEREVSEDLVVSWGNPLNISYGGTDVDILTEELFHCKQIDDGTWKFKGMDRETLLLLELQAKEFSENLSMNYDKYFKNGQYYVPTEMQIMSGNDIYVNVSKKDYLRKDVTVELPTYSEEPTPASSFERPTQQVYRHTGVY